MATKKIVDPKKKAANPNYQYSIVEDKPVYTKTNVSVTHTDDRTGKTTTETRQVDVVTGKPVATDTTVKDIYANNGVIGVAGTTVTRRGSVPSRDTPYVTEYSQVTQPEQTRVTELNANTGQEVAYTRNDFNRQDVARQSLLPTFKEQFSGKPDKVSFFSDVSYRNAKTETDQISKPLQTRGQLISIQEAPKRNVFQNVLGFAETGVVRTASRGRFNSFQEWKAYQGDTLSWSNIKRFPQMESGLIQNIPGYKTVIGNPLTSAYTWTEQKSLQLWNKGPVGFVPSVGLKVANIGVGFGKWAIEHPVESVYGGYALGTLSKIPGVTPSLIGGTSAYTGIMEGLRAGIGTAVAFGIPNGFAKYKQKQLNEAFSRPKTIKPYVEQFFNIKREVGIDPNLIKVKSSNVQGTFKSGDYSILKMERPGNPTVASGKYSTDKFIESIVIPKTSGSQFMTIKRTVGNTDYYIRSVTSSGITQAKVFKGDTLIANLKYSPKTEFKMLELLPIIKQTGNIKTETSLIQTNQKISRSFSVETNQNSKFSYDLQQINYETSVYFAKIKSPFMERTSLITGIDETGKLQKRVIGLKIENPTLNFVNYKPNKEFSSYTMEGNVISERYVPTYISSQKIRTRDIITGIITEKEEQNFLDVFSKMMSSKRATQTFAFPDLQIPTFNKPGQKYQELTKFINAPVFNLEVPKITTGSILPMAFASNYPYESAKEKNRDIQVIPFESSIINKVKIQNRNKASNDWFSSFSFGTDLGLNVARVPASKYNPIMDIVQVPAMRQSVQERQIFAQTQVFEMPFFKPPTKTKVPGNFGMEIPFETPFLPISFKVPTGGSYDFGFDFKPRKSKKQATPSFFNAFFGTKLGINQKKYGIEQTGIFLRY